MNQLSLFTDLPVCVTAPVAPRKGSVSKGVYADKRSASDKVQPRVDRPTPADSTPVIAAEADCNKDLPANEQDTLMKLAGLIREGRDQMEAQNRRRTRPVQSIGDLAQLVLERHDLVARRRAAHQEKKSAMVGFADTGSQVHVAS
ncbi:hypothetical protein SAMN06265222_11477 [Neorhodopirellula lusitana]|uniref:Uncharacterized protein n=1 Tax=Neorhodopirellula lusitana TaxID=445327 RepID=A0ABY1QJE3_9BACT|nr:hypothetical protein [Neorhodopirellula lusitana]SMP71578.1 hypothetical protein SAMN06265222_11477 [Neorhodopirellula lusitana]